jgi:hypothetical protein
MDAAAFREFSQECERWASQTSNPSQRQIMRDMARTWMQIALTVERNMGLLDEIDRLRVQRCLRRLMD